MQGCRVCRTPCSSSRSAGLRQRCLWPLQYEITGAASRGASFWDDSGLDGKCLQREEIRYRLYSVV